MIKKGSLLLIDDFCVNRIFLICFICVNNLCASQNIIQQSSQQWIQYYNQSVISNKLTLFSDVGLRVKENCSKLSQGLVRTSLGYPISKKLNGASGFACFYFFGNSSNDVVEYRPFQEFNTNYTFSPVDILQRLRVEMRLYSLKGNKKEFQQQFDLRLRYRFMLNIPIFSILSQKISINMGNELFYSPHLTPENTYLLTNRILLGLAGKTNHNITWNITYNRQCNQRVGPNINEYIDVIWIALIHKINFGGCN